VRYLYRTTSGKPISHTAKPSMIAIEVGALKHLLEWVQGMFRSWHRL